MRWLTLLLAVSLSFGCGETDSDSGSGGTSSGGAGGTAGDAGGGVTACGSSLQCDASSVCVVDVKAPSCSAKADDAGTCPSGTTETQCGGIGYACCCEPPPPSEYRCESAAGCAAEPDCSCLGAVCKNGQMCMGIGGKEREFHCSDPPAP